MVSQKLQGFLYGVLITTSLVSAITYASTHPDGVFGGYFERMTGICDDGEIITGFDSGATINFGKKECTNIRDILADVFGFSAITAPEGQAMIGFDENGDPVYSDINWHNDGTNISYTGGNVGIGTDTPSAKLDVVGGGISAPGVAIGYLDASKNININPVGWSYFIGNLGIGTFTPTEKLEVAGNTKISGTLFINSTTQVKMPSAPCTGEGKVMQWDGTNWVCGTIPINGKCGGANGTSNPGYPSSGFCATGNKVDVDPSGADGTYNWRCDGVNGGDSPSCSSRPYEIRCRMRLDNDCGYSGTPNFVIYTTCGNFTVGRTDWGASNIFPIPGNSSCTINGDSAVGIGGPIAIPIGSEGNIWYNGCDDTSYLYCGIY